MQVSAVNLNTPARRSAFCGSGMMLTSLEEPAKALIISTSAKATHINAAIPAILNLSLIEPKADQSNIGERAQFSMVGYSCKKRRRVGRSNHYRGFAAARWLNNVLGFGYSVPKVEPWKDACLFCVVFCAFCSTGSVQRGF